jgi:hypothetical protein
MRTLCRLLATIPLTVPALAVTANRSLAAAAVSPCPETLAVEFGGRLLGGVLIDQDVSIEGVAGVGRYLFIDFALSGLYVMDNGSRIRIDCEAGPAGSR